MAALSTQRVVLNATGTTITYAAASGGGDTFTPDDRTIVRIKNGDGSSHTASFAVGRSGPGATTSGPLVVTVAAGTEVDVGPFPFSDWANSGTGVVAITWSATTSMTVAVTGI